MTSPNQPPARTAIVRAAAKFDGLGGDFWNKIRALLSRTAKVVETESMVSIESHSG